MSDDAESRYSRGVFGGAAVTDRDEPGTTGGAALTSGWREDLPFILAMLSIAAAIGLVDVFSVVDENRRAGHPLAIWEPATWEGSSVVVICALGPLITAMTRRVWPLSLPRWRVAVLHLAAMLAFAVGHMTLAGILRWGVYLAVGRDYSAISLLINFVYELRKDALIYIGIVVAYVIWRLYRASIAPQAADDEPREAIEVRDGARRHFVPLSEVVFIEAAGNYVELHRGQTPILHRAPLSELERQLQNSGFIRIHRSRLVRRAAIAQVESKPSGDYVVRLTDGRELAGSRRYRRPLLES